MKDINWNDLEKSIEETKTPLALLYIFVINKNLCEDDELVLILQFFFKYHLNLFFDYNILKIETLLNDYHLSINILNDFYYLIEKRNNILNKFIFIKKSFEKKWFWKKKICDQIEYLFRLQNRFLSIFDCSIGNISFQLKLRALYTTNIKKSIIDSHTDEIINRLRLVYKLFGQKFFYSNNILLVTPTDIYDMTFINRINYFEYIFKKVCNILNEYINIFTLYKSILSELDSLRNPVPINFELDTIDSEFDILDF